MNVLILGSGGREHALAWKISQSPLLKHLYVAPGNAGTLQMAVNIDLSPHDFGKLAEFVKDYSIDMLVVGPEAPLVEGIQDYFAGHDDLSRVMVIGPSAKGAMLEGSKDYANRFMEKYGIPTAKFKTFRSGETEAAIDYMRSLPSPWVLKADGLAAGKGVVILDEFEPACNELREMLSGKFGKASEKVVIEEFLDGIELSVFVLTDGRSWVRLPEAKDYKRIGEGNTGPNTGGMGSLSPVPFAGKEFLEKIETRIIEPTIQGLQAEGIDYRGFIFFGLINVGNDPYVIEYNVRLGDPETQSVLPRLKTDLLPMLQAAWNRELSSVNAEFEEYAAASVVLASGGYPGKYEKGKTISGLDKLAEDTLVFHAGTDVDAQTGEIITAGGRVMAVTGKGKTLEAALQKAYREAGKISFDKIYYRKDLGFDLKLD
ncbi:MAG: phosphoribosylamine--glycine ligase [Bacteroidales bacterium]